MYSSPWLCDIWILQTHFCLQENISHVQTHWGFSICCYTCVYVEVMGVNFNKHKFILPNQASHCLRTHCCLFNYFLWLISRRQKEKRINPPSAAMGSPTICSVAGPNSSSMFASIANSLAGGPLSAIGNPISLVTSSPHSFVGAGGAAGGPQAPAVKTEWLFSYGPWWRPSEVLQGLARDKHSTDVCWSVELYQTRMPRIHIYS